MAFADNLPQDLQEALDALAERSLGKTDAGREVAELMAARAGTLGALRAAR